MPKHSGKWISYLRVSTDRQGKTGWGIEAQRKAVADFLNGGRWALAREFVEVESGRRSDRPQLAAALALCRKLKAALVIAKLDRLTRNTKFLLTLLDAGVDVVFCDLPQVPPGAMGRFFVTQMVAVAELEAGLTGERTRAALAQAKQRGVKLGNPRLSEVAGRGAMANREAADRFAANVLPVIRDIQNSGATSLRAVAAALTARGVRTARGGTWTPVHVNAILRRAS
jgi:DNA invertase Pin-like site-specific DNA recombinase